MASAAALSVLWCAPAGAHPFLRTSFPQQDEVLRTRPRVVRLFFNEALGKDFGVLRVYNDRGLRIDEGVSHASRYQISAQLYANMSPGTYVVHYRVLGGDGHPAADSLVFHYLKTTRAGIIDAGPGKAGVFEGLLRWSALAALAIALGQALFLGPGRSRWPRVAALLCLLALLASEAVRLSGLSLLQALGPSVLAQVARSPVGLVRLAQIGLVLAAVLWPPSGVGGLGLALAAEGFSGHALTAHPSAPAIAAQAAHVVAMGVWLGGLVALVGHRQILPKFRNWALGSVGVLIATGIYNSFVEVGSWGRLVSTTYGRILVVKILALTLVLVLAWLNRTKGVQSGRVFAEVAGVTLIVAMAAALSGLSPARAGEGPFSKVFALGAWRASFVVDPNLAGANEVHLFLLSGPGQLAADARSASVTVIRPGEHDRPHDLRIKQEGAGHFVAVTGAINHAGRWKAMVMTTRLDGAQFRRAVGFEVAP